MMGWTGDVGVCVSFIIESDDLLRELRLLVMREIEKI